MTIDERLEALVHTAELHEHTIVGIERTLRRAVKLGVREVRAERERRAKAIAAIDERISQLAAAQLVSEEKMEQLRQSLQRFLDRSVRDNGHGKSS